VEVSLQQLAHALNGKIKGDQVLAPGPGHSPGDASLSVKISPEADGGFVVKSFANDDWRACKDYVLDRLGLPKFQPKGRRPKADMAQLIQEAVSAEQRMPKTKPSKTYNYKDRDGTLLYQVLRYEPKNFRQRRPDGKGGWTWKLAERRVLYRWPELLKYRDATVFVCEGEKDADRVASIDHCATTVAAGKWTGECVEALAGRDVVILRDNDDAGAKKALATAEALHGTAKSVRVVLLPDLPDKGDVSDWLDADQRRAEKLVDACFDMPEWTPEAASANLSVTADDAKATNEHPLPFINIAAWHGQPVPERIWTVKDRIPSRAVTLLSGEGSIGKSILSMQLGVAVPLGRDWIGTLPEPGPTLIVNCEDDTNELWRRLDLIFRHYNAAYSEFKDLHLMALAGEETLMAAPDRNGLIQPTKLFTRIREAACDIRPKLIVLDNAADIYGGNENDRAQVRQFIAILRGMAIAAGAGVLLTSHPSLTGISTGTGLSGSTAWNASVRSRLYFKRATTDRDEEPDPDLRVLEVMKSNYGPIGETITLRWKDGLFLPVGGVSNLDKIAAERRSEELFLKLLKQFTGQGRNTCDKFRASTYAPTLFAQEPAAREQGIRKADLEDAMRRLFAAEKIGLVSYGPPSKNTSKLAIK
jgi:RecA-family ATPase/5S rRNA maturation endonuclease (ribonuclease M5)